MKYYFLFFLLIGCCISEMFAQKRLRIDRVNKKSVYVDIGQELTFLLEGHEDYLTLTITDILPKENVIIFPSLGMVDISTIKVIKMKKGRKNFARKIALMLYRFAATWAFYSVIDDSINGKLSKGSIIVPLASVALGGIIQLLFANTKKYKIGKNASLQAINLNLIPLNA